MATRCYYLFKWRIWTIIDDSDIEEEESLETDSSLTISTQLADGNPPDFGFTPWTPHYLEEEE